VLGLETVFLALLLFLLWHPALSVARLRPQQNIVAVLIDASRSMALNDAGGTRLGAAEKALHSGLLDDLKKQFQVREYRFGETAERVAEGAAVQANLPATHLGESLDRVLAESSGLPLGSIVLLSDGSDNSGGVGRDTIARLRSQRVPVQTIGYGRERNDHDMELEDVSLPQRALAGSRLSATARFRQLGFGGTRCELDSGYQGHQAAARRHRAERNGAVQRRGCRRPRHPGTHRRVAG
jgi:hypothetical protein